MLNVERSTGSDLSGNLFAKGHAALSAGRLIGRDKEDNMSVICIARAFGALGDETGTELAKLTGYRLFDKDHIEQLMAERGLKPGVRERYDEKKPGFWASLSQDRDDYLHYLTSVLYAEAIKGDCIIVGRGALALFSGLPSVLKIRLDAAYDFRLRNIITRFSCDARHAQHLLKQQDHDRKGFYDYFFNLNWLDPNNYHLTINSEWTPPAAAAAVIDRLRQLLVTPDSTAACAKRLAELNLGRQLISELIYHQHIPIHFLEAEVAGTKVTLHGVANTQGAIEAAISAARKVPGVVDVENAIQIVQEFAVMP
ncbi:MAG TPA: phospholipid-binding protein [Spirochaetaceae bacterium]|nr:phospholipid-binding protein [Spirochaetaceae bacterium]HAW86230.1 phospholipid-binding protein [Spirochaetaceae bacterium]HAX36569.1 phospholipid-binding protein [Spirochaetaceae bacterium]HBO40413.1 phospholipid-binding protein [Spirochaetaceae bacterium]HCQ86532.1 phospholipid-binding protein [Spirochaetaceae bacterium]